MRILFVSHKWPAMTGESCVRALQELGHTVEIAWAKIGSVSSATKIYSWLRRKPLLSTQLLKIELEILNNIIIRKTRKFRPDLVIINAGGEVAPATLLEIKKTGAFVVCWAGDDPTAYRLGPYYMAGAGLYDYYFLIDPEWYNKELKSAGVKKCSILQYGVDPTIYHPVQLSERESKFYGADVCHLGVMHGDREKVLTELLDCDIALWGAVSMKALRKFSSLPEPLLLKVRSGAVNAHTANKIYCSSKICLNIQHPQVKSAHSNKTFEIIASGAFLITSYSNHNDITFRDELVSYRTVKELRGQIDYFLKNETERKKIAEKNYSRVISSHLYSHRMIELLAECRL